MKALSLFSGIGGLDLAAEAAGIKIAALCEIEPFPASILRKRWPSVPLINDVRTISKEVLLALIKDKYQDVIFRYDAGESIQQIANSYGITRQAMWNILKRRGCRFRPKIRFGQSNHFFRGGRIASDNAQNLLEEAIEKGIVKRRDVCEKCGCTQKFKDGRSGIQAHHCDYNKPYDVMWLCQKCHHEWHKNNKAIPKIGGVANVEATENKYEPIDIVFGGFPQ